MSAQHNTIALLPLLFLLLTACGGGAKYDGENDITLSVSLGPSSSYPDNATDEQDDIYYYRGRLVHFSIQGIDEQNNTIDIKGSSALDWTGTSYEDSTLYASHTFRVENEDDIYPGGRYKMRMYIDWNGNSILDEGDVYMTSYKVFADQDEDSETANELVEENEWGTHIEYLANEESIVIDDPLDVANGTPWLIREVGEGRLRVWE